MKPPSATEIAQVIEDVRGTIPNVRVVIKPHCDGRAWYADHCCATVYISGALPADSFMNCLRDALDVLVTAARCAAALRAEIGPLADVPMPRFEPGYAQSG